MGRWNDMIDSHDCVTPNRSKPVEPAADFDCAVSAAIIEGVPRRGPSGRTPWAFGLVLAACCYVSGCTELSVGVSRPTPLPRFLSLSRASTTQVYRLTAGDQITTRFYYNPQLDEDLQVRPDGNISLSLIGELRAIGKTAGELSAEITRAYAQYFVKPTAVVIVRQFTGHRVFTSGELRNPGQFSLITSARTVLESLAASGGVTDNGTLTHVILIRRLPNQQNPMVAELDLADALSGEDPSQDVTLMPNDFVYVPKSGAAGFDLAMQQYLFRPLNLTTGASFATGYNIQR
jgi:polysaccharide biosynthesis/export protein